MRTPFGDDYKRIIVENKATFELYCFSAAYSIMPTLASFYKESHTSVDDVQGSYYRALATAIEQALNGGTAIDNGRSYLRGESVANFRFEARVRIYDNEVSFDLNFKMNGGTVEIK